VCVYVHSLHHFSNFVQFIEIYCSLASYRHVNNVKLSVGKMYSPQFHLLKAAEDDDVDTVKTLISKRSVRDSWRLLIEFISFHYRV